MSLSPVSSDSQFRDEQPINYPKKGKLGSYDVEEVEALEKRLTELEGTAPSRKSTCLKATGWVGVAIAIVALLIGVGGLLVYLGQLQLGLQGIGVMSKTTGLYSMLAGFGVTFIAGVLSTISCCCSNKKPKTEEAQSKSWFSLPNVQRLKFWQRTEQTSNLLD